MKKQRKRRKKIIKRAGCLSLAILAFLIVIVPCFLLYRCVENWGYHAPIERISPADSIYHARLDTLISKQTRIDKEQTSLYIYDLTEDCPVYGYQDTLELPPASCMKLVTTLNSTHFMGLDYRFADSLFVGGVQEGETLKGDLIIKGDYDPLIESLDTLITAIKQQGIKRIEGNVVFDLPLNDPFEYQDSWTPGDIRRGAIPIMLKGEARIRKDFMYLLHKAGIQETGASLLGNKPAEAECFFSVGHTLEEILVPTLLYSSNIMAETVFTRMLQVCGNLDEVYNFMGDELKVPVAINIEDGSGLSPENSVTPIILCALLKQMWDGETGWIMKALPKAGSESQRGTLMNRMANNDCKERIYAKTGTLNSTGTSSLAGYCQGLFGHWYAFAVINHNTPVAEGRLFQDAVCYELVREE